ncbi:SWIM zinc finger family protein [Streptomyces sp. UG1]|uniref:SWIM zinc finger family protein n=1 Tax=Streptomyces sp. UG1 TaxID=3417652 RepID=UPI003CEC813F
MPPSDAPHEGDAAAMPDAAPERHGHEPTSPTSHSPSHPAGPPASAAGSTRSRGGSSAMPTGADALAARPPTDPNSPASHSTPAPDTPKSHPPTGTTPTPTPTSTPPIPPSTPQIPHSMAAPGRDGELRRTFPAFAPRPSSDEARFAESWWGNAWVRALEEGALDPKRLARGRGYAQEGHVDAITVTPGLVLAYVRGSRPRPYRVQVRLRTLDDADWARFLDTVAERPGHIAALLDKEMPQTLAECGVPLLPGPGDLDPRCSCPDRGHPCKHAAALCYQTARLLDADPFVLLLLRGRGERQLLDALSRLSAARAARAAQEREPAPLAGVRATEALDPQRQLSPLPAPLPMPPHPEQPPVYPAAPGGPDPFALDQLATDAAARAHALLGTGRDPVGELTLWQDAVRLAAARPGSGLTAATRALYASLASAADRTPADLARAVAAWRQGGFEGLAVLEEPWDPPAGRFDRARPLLLAADLPAFRPWRNHLTHPRGHVQLRFGRDGLWYPYESEPGHDDWWPRGTPDLDPVGALTGLDSVGAAPEL